MKKLLKSGVCGSHEQCTGEKSTTMVEMKKKKKKNAKVLNADANKSDPNG